MERGGRWERGRKGEDKDKEKEEERERKKAGRSKGRRG